MGWPTLRRLASNPRAEDCPSSKDAKYACASAGRGSAIAGMSTAVFFLVLYETDKMICNTIATPHPPYQAPLKAQTCLKSKLSGPEHPLK